MKFKVILILSCLFAGFEAKVESEKVRDGTNGLIKYI